MFSRNADLGSRRSFDAAKLRRVIIVLGLKMCDMRQIRIGEFRLQDDDALTLGLEPAERRAMHAQTAEGIAVRRVDLLLSERKASAEPGAELRRAGRNIDRLPVVGDHECERPFSIRVAIERAIPIKANSSG